ncbi:MAG: CsbD family protein [Armatimonadetes bacterium]|nr:CsbD family protein [Armatimonadota bacterium]
MDRNIIDGKWKELKGYAREEWSKLTRDELGEVGGKKDRLEGKLQQKYGRASDEADRRAGEWAKHQDAKHPDEAGKS